MREYDKMISGELYDPTDIELRELRKRVRELTREYNATTEDDAEKRIEILDRILGSHGKNFYMEPYIRFDYGVNTCVGENFLRTSISRFWTSLPLLSETTLCSDLTLP